MKSFEYDSKVLDKVVEMVENGSSKGEVQNWLMAQLEDYPSVDKYIRHSGVKFSKPAGNWDACLEYFRESDEPTKEGLQSALEAHGMTEAQAKKYCSSYWYPLNGMYEIFS